MNNKKWNIYLTLIGRVVEAVQKVGNHFSWNTIFYGSFDAYNITTVSIVLILSLIDASIELVS